MNLENVKNFLDRHIDYKLYTPGLITLITFILIFPCIIFAPESFGYENGVIENVQMFVLFLAIILCFSAKYNKKFFRFFAFILIMLVLREINCFRTIFYPRPDTVDEFYSWNEIFYNYAIFLTSFDGKTKVIEGVLKLKPIVHGLFGTYIALVALFFFVKKIFVDFFNMISKVKMPFWCVIFAVISMLVSEISDKAIDNAVLEECFELLFYVATAALIWLYSRCKKFDTKNDDNN